MNKNNYALIRQRDNLKIFYKDMLDGYEITISNGEKELDIVPTNKDFYRSIREAIEDEVERLDKELREGNYII